MKKISKVLTKYMAVIVILIAALALFVPKSCIWIQSSWVNYLLIIVMFVMGLNMNLEDIAVVFTKPRDLILGCVVQYVAMPVLAFGLGKMFFLDEELLAGLIILGCCPGGTASNVMTYLSKGESAFSIGMTAVTNLLSPVITPVLTYLFLRKTISVDVKSMILAIIFVVIVPLLLGMVINRILSRLTENVKYILPSVADIAIFLIVASTVSHNSDRIRATGIKIIIAAILLNLLGYLFGYIFGSSFMMKMKRKKALTLEIGMQNSGMATSLAVAAFPGMAMAAVPAAVFSVWQYVSGAVLAGIFRKISKKSKKSRPRRKD